MDARWVDDTAGCKDAPRIRVDRVPRGHASNAWTDESSGVRGM